jgi:hypothetical protein
MTIETKFLIGLLLLMAIGSFLCSFLGADNNWNNVTTTADNFSNSFSSTGYKGAWNVVFQGGDFLWNLLGLVGTCIFWNFSFFEGFRWLQIMLIFINLVILLKVMVDIWRMLKPFGG